MNTKILFPALLLLVASIGVAQAQSEDDEPLLAGADILEPSEEQPFEGSGAGVIEPPAENTTEAENLPAIEEIENSTPSASDTYKYLCPETCTCNTEVIDEYNKYIVDCSDKNLEELPADIDARVTELNLQNNKLNVVPKVISELKKLQVLNLNNNSITELAAGSLSELPELKILKLSNNRLLEYPQELKNGFALVKLEEIDLSGNDIRSTLSVDNFSIFILLRKLILPTSDTDFVEVLCNKLKNTLETVCVGSCLDWANECPNTPEQIDEDFMGGKLPGTISLTSSLLDVAPVEGIDESKTTKDDENFDANGQASTDVPSIELPKAAEPITTSTEKESANFSLLTAVVDRSSSNILPTEENKNVDPVANNGSSSTGQDVKVGATTSQTNTGAVDKSLIGIIVAGMIVIVAGITIKKNWGSLKKRFGSASEAAPERTRVNGTSPEEVPLQEKGKSPV